MAFPKSARSGIGAAFVAVGALALTAAPLGCGLTQDDESSNEQPVIYDLLDNRKNVVDYLGDQQVLQWADSVAVLGKRPGAPFALCWGSDNSEIEAGPPSGWNEWCQFKTVAGNLGPLPEGVTQPIGLCSGQKFANERRLVENCTAFRVGERRFVTAGHCLKADGQPLEEALVQCSDAEVAFGFQITSPFNPHKNQPAVPRSVRRALDVYQCSSVIARHVPVDENDPDQRDFTIFDVNRPVRGRHLLRARQIDPAQVGDATTLLGHGLGFPLKISPSGSIKSVTGTANLDTNNDSFAGDSGGPFMAAATGLVTGLLQEVPLLNSIALDSSGTCYNYAPMCSSSSGCTGGGIPFSIGTDIANFQIASLIPTPPANPSLVIGDLNADTIPDHVSLITQAGFYYVDVQLSGGGSCPVCPIPTLIPENPFITDLSTLLNVADFNGDLKEDVIVKLPGLPPAYLDGASLLSFNPWSVLGDFLAATPFSPTWFQSLALGDFNNDDIYDVQASPSAGSIHYALMGTRGGPVSPAGLAPAVPIPEECGERVALKTNHAYFVDQGYKATRAVAVIPGSLVGLADPRVLAIDCPGPTSLNRMKLLDPLTGAVRKTVTLSGASNWRAFAYRVDKGDLIGLRSTDDPATSYTVARIPLSSGTTFSPVDLFSHPQDGIAVGLGWKAYDEKFRVLVDGIFYQKADRIDRFDAVGTFVIDDAVPLTPCGGNFDPAPAPGGLAVSGNVELLSCNWQFGGVNGHGALVDLDITGAGPALAFNKQPAMLHDVECDPDTFSFPLLPKRSVVWGVARSGRVIRAFPVDGSKCGTGGGPPLTAQCITPGGAGANVTYVAAGGNSTVARISDGTVLVTGANGSGQLGVGTTSNVLSLAASQGYYGAVALGVGSAHTLGVFSNGSVAASGSNTTGQLGVSGVSQTSVPVTVTGLSSIIAVSAGDQFSMALTSQGAVYTWGSNTYGQLGDSTPGYRTTPAQVQIGATIVAISAGARHALAVASDGSVWAWGSNEFGQLGNGSFGGSVSVPARVFANAGGSQLLSGANKAAGGADHSMALLSNGQVATWGGNRYGQLGDGTTTDRAYATSVANFAYIQGISAGAHFSLAVQNGGSAYSWGRNDLGQLGTGDTTNRSAPGRIRDNCGPSGYLSPVTMLAAGAAHGIATERFVTWGDNSAGQLGTGGTESSLLPWSIRLNALPRCNTAVASPATITTITGSLTTVNINGAVDPEGQPLTIATTAIFADEPQNGVADPDGVLSGSTAQVRAEYLAAEDGRVYTIGFRAVDSAGGQCMGTVRVCVHPSGQCGNQGAAYVATQMPSQTELCQAQSDSTDVCFTCLQKQCCSALAACQAPDACAIGGPQGTGELPCVQQCIDNELANGQPLQDARDRCASICATTGGVVNTTTNAVLNCMTYVGTPNTPGACFGTCVHGDL